MIALKYDIYEFQRLRNRYYWYTHCVSIIDMDFLYQFATILEMRLNHKYQETANKYYWIWQLALERLWIRNLYCFVGTTLQQRKLMMNITKKWRDDWLAKWLIMLGSTDLRQPRVSRHSTSVLFVLQVYLYCVAPRNEPIIYLDMNAFVDYEILIRYTILNQLKWFNQNCMIQLWVLYYLIWSCLLMTLILVISS